MADGKASPVPAIAGTARCVGQMQARRGQSLRTSMTVDLIELVALGSPPHLLDRQQQLLVPPAARQDGRGQQVLQGGAERHILEACLPARHGASEEGANNGQKAITRGAGEAGRSAEEASL